MSLCKCLFFGEMYGKQSRMWILDFFCEVRNGTLFIIKICNTFYQRLWSVALPPHHPSLFWVTPWRNSQPSWPACVSHWVFNSYCYNIESPLFSTHLPHTVYNVCKFQQKLFYSFLLLSTSPVSLINLLSFPVLVGLDHVEEDPWDTQSSQHLSSDQGHL